MTTRAGNTSPPPAGAAPVLAVAAAVAAIGLAGFAVYWTLRPAPVATPIDVMGMRALAEELVRAPQPSRVRTDPPQWIWGPDAPKAGDTVRLRRTFDVARSPRAARLVLSADNAAEILLDGAAVGETESWESPVTIDLTGRVGRGQHTLEVQATNREGPAGVCASLRLTFEDGTHDTVVTDGAWEVARSGAAASPVVVIGPIGMGPWGSVPGLADGDIDRGITVPAGFSCELVASVPRDLGSVVSLCALPDGTLIAGVEGNGLLHVRPCPIGGDPNVSAIERLPIDIGGAQGLLLVDSTLYVVVNGPFAQGSGLYALDDSDGDGQLDRARLLRRFEGDGGEHGPHGLARGPDGLIYLMCGNHSPLPNPERSLVPRVWDEDIPLPRLWDANGHAVGVMAPGGWVCRTDSEGRTFEVFAIGFRNAYDIAFDRWGELFSYDSDMEWDMGAPWYRPTRITHVVPGAEFGWRSGSACWPSWYPDSVPPVIDVGPGSPTGIVFLHDSNFPLPWRDALLALDWTYGTIHAIHLEPAGASYRARRETFLTGKPLPLTDAVVSPADRSLYFSVGGRRATSAIYRVHAHEPASGNPSAPGRSPTHESRRALESLLATPPSLSAVDRVWPDLGHADRGIRYAARTALEHQPVGSWTAQALAETHPVRAAEALLALVRCGDDDARGAALQALSRVEWEPLGPETRRAVARATMVGLSRAATLSAHDRDRLRRAWDARFPTGDDELDRVVSEVLVALESRAVVAKAVALLERGDREEETFDESLLGRSDTYGTVILRMAAASPQRQQVHMASVLRHAKAGWTPQLRERYFRWFPQARRSSGGLSFSGFLEAIRRAALANVPEAEREAYERVSAADDESLAGDRPSAEGPGRAWTTGEVERVASARSGARDFARGERMFAAASCADCHRLAGLGKAGGPDLTGIGNRFGPAELAQAIVEPSAVVSDQYALTEFTLADGSVVVGRVVSEESGEVGVIENMLAPEAVRRLRAEDIRERRRSDISPMMAGLINTLNEEELADLLAYLRSGGDRRLVE